MKKIIHGKIKLLKNFSIDLLIYFFPILAILGAPAVNILIVLICFLYLKKIERISYDFSKINIYLSLFFIFWLYIFFLSFFSKYYEVAIYSSFVYIRFIIFALAVSYIVTNKLNFQKLINYFLIAILFVDVDIILQYFIGYDIFGYSKSIDRLGGPFGTELVAGAFLSKISLPVLSLAFYKIKIGSLKEKLFNLFLIILTTISILLSGDRLPSIHILIFLILGMLLFFSFRNCMIALITLLFSLLLLINSSTVVKNRFEDTKIIFNNFSNSSYYALYENAINVWKQNKFFGVGIKNYNVICDEITKDSQKKQHQPCSTHPHNIFLELIVSTGIIGTVIFYSIFIFIFIEFLKVKKKPDKDRTYLLFGSCITILFYINPISTTGSIFTSWNSSFLWFHLGLSSGLYKIIMRIK
jgi:O-antigen ligase